MSSPQAEGSSSSRSATSCTAVCLCSKLFIQGRVVRLMPNPPLFAAGLGYVFGRDVTEDCLMINAGKNMWVE